MNDDLGPLFAVKRKLSQREVALAEGRVLGLACPDCGGKKGYYSKACQHCIRASKAPLPGADIEAEPETWITVPGYEGKYEVSDLGRVRSLRFTNGHADMLRPEPLILRARADSNNRPGVCLCKDGTRKTTPVHAIVLTAFVGPCPSDKDLCAHWDGDPFNNRLLNLRWATFVENEADKKRHNRHLSGERNHRAVITDAQALEIRRRLHAGERPVALSVEYNVSKTTISEIALHRTFRDIPGSPPPIRHGHRGGDGWASGKRKRLTLEERRARQRERGLRYREANREKGREYSEAWKELRRLRGKSDASPDHAA